MHCSVMYPLQLLTTVFSYLSPQNYEQANSAPQQLKDLYALEIKANIQKLIVASVRAKNNSQSAEQVVT